MPVSHIIIAGPQAAGKSTLKSLISQNLPNIIPLEEVRQIVVHKHQRKGAIFMKSSDEIEVIHKDFERMFEIIEQSKKDFVYLDETNVFTLGHARAHGIDLLEGYFRQYCDMFTRLKSGVLFVDVPPDISWHRRRSRYEERVWSMQDQERDKTLSEYRQYLDRLHPELLQIYDRLEVPKVKIDGTGSIENAIESALESLGKFKGKVD